MLKIVEKDRTSNTEFAQVYFALGKAFQDIKNFNASFNYYTKANLLRKKVLKYNINSDKIFFKNIQDFFVSLKEFSFK